MKKYILLFSLFLIGTISARADFGIWASAVYINTNGTSQFYSTQLLNDPNSIGTVNFGSNLGTFQANTNTLSILGAELKTFRSDGGNVCGGNIYFTVYPVGARPGSPTFNAIGMNFLCDCNGGNFNSCGGGTCTDGRDQKWQRIDQATDLTQLAVGDYTLELYYEISGNASPNSCTESRFDSDFGNNYKANFSITSNLSVNFSGLSGLVFNNTVKLKWSVDSDADVVKYEILRSANGVDFNSADIIDSKKSLLPFTYFVTDNSPFSGVNFYRIKFWNSDNTFSYSNIYKISLGKMGSNLQILPFNGNAGTISVRLKSITAGNYRIRIINSLGQQVFTQNVIHDGYEKTFSLDMNKKIAKGIYRLVMTNKGDFFNETFLVN